MCCCLGLGETGALVRGCQIKQLVGGVLHEREAHRSHHNGLIRQCAEGIVFGGRFTTGREPQQHLGEFAPQAGFGAGMVKDRLGRLAGFTDRLGIGNGRLGGSKGERSKAGQDKGQESQQGKAKPTQRKGPLSQAWHRHRRPWIIRP